ncbi:urea transporter [Streptomyces sp. 130]|uniref:urea transporter n=1 Tax=Streptomyces sp. 130 TaxID=2591006 RepID=UPI00117C92B3|nr:urea transporter [Streptomyces sp. 130]TRV75711.1 urea transporter [Streptomyces sp. 130]
MSLAEPDHVRRLESRQPSAYLLASLRGVGQVDFQASLFTGAAILAGLWVAGWETGLFATLGTLIATAVAYALAVDRGSIALGMQGFAGCLTGIALVSTLGNHPATYVLTVVGAALCVVLMAALATLLAPYRLSPMTAPFCLVSGVMVVGAPSFDRVWHGAPAAVSSTTSGDTGITWNDLWHAFFNNVSQVFLVESWYVGLIMLAGLALAGPRVVLWAAAGSVTGIVAAWLLGAPTALIANGIYGYNAVLVAIGLGAVFLAPTVWNGLYTLLGAAVSTGLTATLTSFFKPFGGHTFTWPFILTTWTLLVAVELLPRLRRSD